VPAHDPPPIRPDPDPTVLTTASLLREVGNLREATQASINALEKGLLARIEGIEKAIEVAHRDAVRIPTLLQQAIDNLRELTWSRFDVVNEKFHTVATQFTERDTRVEQTAKASKEALDAALQAAEKAVGKQNESFSLAVSKSEAATNKQIDQLGTTIQLATKTTDAQIGDLKERLTRFEGSGSGRQQVRAEGSTRSANIAGWVIGVGGAVAAIIAILDLVLTHSH
jgi:hypothetical protein